MKAKILALLKGKALKDLDNNLLYIKGIVLGLKEESINQSNDYELDELNDMEVYTSKEDIEIRRLNLVISKMQEQIDKLSQPVTSNKKGIHLSKGEVREIEKIFENKPDIKQSLILSTYNTSQSVLSKIKNGAHSKTSSEYKTYLLKQQ